MTREEAISNIDTITSMYDNGSFWYDGLGLEDLINSIFDDIDLVNYNNSDSATTNSRLVDFLSQIGILNKEKEYTKITITMEVDKYPKLETEELITNNDFGKFSSEIKFITSSN